MNTTIHPVIRGEFVYQDTLFVDVGGALKRHPRASLAHLKTFLDGRAPKDQVAHWYEAQLIHYGLQRSKDKNTAKVRLQQAISQKRLTVPSHIVDMEAQMKKEFAASVRKALGAASQPESGLYDGQASPNRERKNDNEQAAKASASSKKTKITMKVGEVEFSIDHDLAEAVGTGKRAQATLGKTYTEPPPPKSSPVKRNYDSNGTFNNAAPKTPQSKRANAANPRPTPTASSTRKHTAHIPTTQGRGVSPAKPKTEPGIKREYKYESEDEPLPTQRYITGNYNISCPLFEMEYPHAPQTFSLSLCVDNEARKIWGGFELPSFSGVILIRDDYDVPGASLSFGWRARDAYDGRLSFGRGCFGEIVFFGDQQVRGTFFNLLGEPVDFEGERRRGPLWCGKSAWQFEREWDGFVAEACGR